MLNKEIFYSRLKKLHQKSVLEKLCAHVSSVYFVLSRDVPYSLWPTGGSLVPPSMQLRCSVPFPHTPNAEVRLPRSHGAKMSQNDR